MSWQVILFAVVAVLAAGVAGLWHFQANMTHRFGTDAQNPQPPAELRRFTAADGTELRAWVADAAPDQPVLISFHGNFASTGPSFDRMLPLAEGNVSLVMLQYRGANGAPGRPSEVTLAADARALWDGLDEILGREIPADRRILHGISLGAAVAGRLATERTAGAVILEAAPERLCQFWTRRFRGLPLCLLMWRERYDLIDHVPAIAAPLLLVHGSDDATIPLSEAQRLEAASAGRLAILPGGGHANLQDHGLFDEIEGFLAEVGLR